MDFLKWTIFFCMLTSAVAANLPLLTSSEENYAEDFYNYDDDYYGESVDEDVDICTLPPIDHSPNQRRCSGFIPRWYYDAQSNSCKKFFWNGCWGTRNLFKNEFACLARCNKQGLQRKLSESDASALCMQPKASGSCRASIPSYFFDVQTGKCTPFNYGGCGGNGNRFKTYHECDFRCNRLEQAPLTHWPQFANSSVAISASAEKVLNAVQLTKEEKCSLPPVESTNSSSSSCLAYIPSWTFNWTAGECRSFVYEGCGKTTYNLFNSVDECIMACGPDEPIDSGPSSPPSPPRCLLPKVTGPCRASVPSFFYDATAGVCTSFNYGGCGGNDNRFTSIEACQLACSGPGSVPDVGLMSMSKELLPGEVPVSGESEEV
uniref:BPTI/Kunitz inhibitor domain-containing protein n=1 Tax=Daphnia galeata TaxID=27404 RepID=A0A8J2RKB2_9CRUS|nr:unnamed protein product [Daphnia galeata]